MANKKTKAVILARVSSDAQDYQRQVDELAEMARKEGYGEVEVIADKESAIKLRESERRGLTELKEVCAAGDVGLVLVWEISRLARRQSVLYSVRDFLVERGIQLVVQTPYIKLLDQDGKITESANLVFAVSGALAETEMSIKQERMKSGKQRARRAGKYIGGHVPYGYRIGDNNMIEVDEQRAAEVRELFSRYAAGERIGTITRNMYNCGRLRMYTTYQSAHNGCRKWLAMPVYCGREPENGMVGPAIISEELYDKAAGRFARELYTDRRGMQYVKEEDSIGRGVLRCGGYAMTMCRQKWQYRSKIREGVKTVSISSAVVDEALWTIACDNWRPSETKESFLELARRHRDLQGTRRKLVRDMDALEAKADRLQDRILDGKISEVKGDQKLAEIAADRKRLESEYNAAGEAIDGVVRQLAAARNSGGFDPRAVSDKAGRCRIVKEVVKVADFSRTAPGEYALAVLLRDGKRLDVEIKSRPRRQTWKITRGPY